MSAESVIIQGQEQKIEDLERLLVQAIIERQQMSETLKVAQAENTRLVEKERAGSGELIVETEMGVRALWLLGEINEESVKDVCGGIMEMWEADKEKPVALYINSFGGSAVAGMAIADFIMASPVQVDTLALGFVQSAALSVFLAGEKRLAYRRARFLLHQGVGSDEGSAVELQAFGRECELLNDWLAEFLAERSGMTLAKVEQLRAEARRFGAEEALEWGIATMLVDPVTRRSGT